MVEREQTECAADCIAPLAEGVESVAERLSTMRDALGGLAIWAAYKQGGQLRGIADDLERLAQDARSAEYEFNNAAAEYHASLTPYFGEIRYNRLCNLAAIKRPRDGMWRKTKEIIVVDDTTIKSDTGIVVLEPDEIGVLNRATKHRRRHLLASDLRDGLPSADGGERSLRQSEFRMVYSGLAAKLEFIVGESVFARVGSGSRIVYVLSSAIQFVDERATQLPEAAVIAENAEEGNREESVVVVTTSEVVDIEDEVLEDIETTVEAALPAEEVTDDCDVPPATPKEVEEPPEVSDEPSATPPPDVPPQSREPNMPKPEVAKRAIDTWHSVDEIAQATGLPGDIVTIFIDRNKHRLGRDFKSPQMRPRPHPTARGSILVQCYSPQFSGWAIASLEAAKRRLAEQNAHSANVQQDADHATPES